MVSIQKLSPLLMLLLAGLTALSAKTIDIPDEKLHIDIPDSWTSKDPMAGAIFYATDDQNSSMVAFISKPNEQNDGIDDPNFLNGIKKGFTNKIEGQGLTVNISAENQVSINNVPFYHFQGTFGLPGGKNITFQEYVTAANGKIYMLSLQSLNDNPSAELTGIANSLAFQSPPVLPGPGKAQGQGESLSYHIGQLFGYFIILVLVGGFIIRAVTKRSR